MLKVLMNMMGMDIECNAQQFSFEIIFVDRNNRGLLKQHAGCQLTY